uniref:E6-2^E6-3 protein n=1 Tax=Human papillomavirus TaxID=10566 RepID=Q89690_9PAPI|nr:E6-2^E6-3 [Human papillomavirus]CAA45433.1 E6-2^E6-3 [Human papillomavirus]
MICAKHWRQLYTTLNYSAWNAKNLCNDLRALCGVLEVPT